MHMGSSFLDSLSFLMNSELDILGVYLARANFKRVHIHLCPTLGHETRWIHRNNVAVVVAGLQPVEIRSRGGAPRVDGGATGHIHSDPI